MAWVIPLTAQAPESADLLGSKGHGLVVLLRLGLPVPPGFVVGTAAGRAYLRDGRFPEGLAGELTAALGDRPGPVSVRSGASVSMPGMMDTLLDVAPADVPAAVAEVFASWNTHRARTYRTLHDIPHDLGTAVVVQSMVFGDRDEHSGSGVAFSRNPNTGERAPYGEVLFGHRGDAVVSGTTATLPLSELAREPHVWAALREALERVERHYRDACHVEFTFESGALFLLQVRPGGLGGPAAVHVAVDLVDEGVIDRDEAVRRITPQQLQAGRAPRMAATDILIQGLGACPGVAAGRVATTADQAARMAADGPVILVRPHTSPLDLHGLAAAAGVLTALGGPASHAAVVARAMGKPAVVGATGLTVGPGGIRAGEHKVPTGTMITIDGGSGAVALGHAPVVTAEADSHLRRLLTWAER